MGCQWKTCCICLLGILFLVSVALIVCVALIILAPAKLDQCLVQLKNDTSTLTGKLKGLQKEKEALERQRDGARAEVKMLQLELAGTNQTLWGHWDACRNRTRILQNNITALEDKIAQLGPHHPEAEDPGEKGGIDKLRQQLLEVQQQRDKLQVDLRRLEQQQHQSQKDHSSSGSSLRVPTILLLALSLAGLLLL